MRFLKPEKMSICFPVLLILWFSSCRMAEETDNIRAGVYPGTSFIGNGEITVVYSDDSKTVDPALPVKGGIRQFYHGDFDASYIRGSSVRFINEGEAVIPAIDTIAISPFFSPFINSSSEYLYVNARIFMMDNGLTVQLVSLRSETDMNLNVEYSLYTPSIPDTGGSVRLADCDLMEDGIILRYDNGLILSAAVLNEGGRYFFNTGDDVITVVTPFHIRALRDTSLTYILATGFSDTEVISKMFAAEESGLFEAASEHWEKWMAGLDIPGTGNRKIDDLVKINEYALFASVIGDDALLWTGTFINATGDHATRGWDLNAYGLAADPLIAREFIETFKLSATE